MCCLNKSLEMATIKKQSNNYFKENWQLYLMLLPTLLYFVIFAYIPMYGIQLAFKDYIPTLGMNESPWVGFEYFSRLVNAYNFKDLLLNTLTISGGFILFSFPLPILLAIMLNEISYSPLKKTIQTITYAPYFISTVVMVGMIYSIFALNGPVNKISEFFGGDVVQFMTKPQWFQPIYIISGIWQTTGWSTIIYISALSGVDLEQHEAGLIDGVTKIQRIWYIDLPVIIPIIAIVLILGIGNIMNVGFEKVFLMQNDLNMSSGDVISTYVYRIGMVGREYSFSTAVGLFNSVINFILLCTVNVISKKITNTGIF